jgi:hypothetical protein
MNSPAHHTPLPRPTRSAPLRMAVLCSGTTFEAWQGEVIRRTLATGLVEPVLLITDGAPTPARPPKSLWSRTLGNKRLVWNLYQRAFVTGKGDATRPTSLEQEFAGVPSLACTAPRVGKFARAFTDDELDKIAGFRPDFCLRFAFNIIKGGLLTLPRLGVWSFHHDDLDVYRGMPACFWPLYFGEPALGVTLQRLTEGLDKGIVIQRAWFKSTPHSYLRSRDATFSSGADMVAKVCLDLAAGSAEYLDAPPSATTAPTRTSPGNLQAAIFCAKLARRTVAHALSTVFRSDQWTVGVIDRPIHTLLSGGECPPARLAPTHRRGTFIADPFGVRRNGTTTVLAEELDDRDDKGRIVALSWPDGKPPTRLGVVLDRPHHLSYPSILELGGQIYCIPEAAESRRIEILRAVEFPTRWEPFAVIAEDFPGIDATVFWHQGRWWCLCAAKARYTELKLHGFSAPELAGPWTPHPCNPLKADIRSTRPAGTPFLFEGRLFRPAQDCSRTYGGSVVFNRVDELTETRFRETPVSTLRPSRRGGFSDGLHTVSAVGDHTLVDAKRTIFIPGRFAREVRRVLRKLAGSGG